jgi:hypothetical protein
LAFYFLGVIEIESITTVAGSIGVITSRQVGSDA